MLLPLALSQNSFPYVKLRGVNCTGVIESTLEDSDNTNETSAGEIQLGEKAW